MAFYVYILASQRNGTLYIGQTDSISRRIWEHKEGTRLGFTGRYGVDRLVYYESYESRDTAFARERAMKKWRRAWKLELIERANPGWDDLTEDLPPRIAPGTRSSPRKRGPRCFLPSDEESLLSSGNPR